ncbi:MAG: DUF1320 domain-containing protein [Betaproteobacteria bacterium]|nr:DUF1320 domain-containing protein [Betaproteobacteria bacterium]
MTAYCTKQDLIDRFGAMALAQLTDEERGATIVDADVEQACESASRTVDDYIGRQVKTPLAVVPDHIREIARDLAYRALHGEKAKEGDGVLLLAAQAMSKLRDYASNRAILLGVDDSQATPVPQIAVIAPKAVFTERLLARMP